MNRAILYMGLDGLFVSVERLKNPALRGRSVIITEQGREVVASCSHESRAFGVYPAMPVQEARKMAPHAIFLPGDMEKYTHHSQMVTQILADAVPVLEKASLNEFYADLSEIGRYPDCWKWALELRERISRETGLPFSIGLSANKLVSKLAAEQAGPGGEKCIRPGAERMFLAPLPLDKVLLTNEKMGEFLSRRGIRTMGDLSGMMPGTLQRLLGKSGIALWQKANGICHNSVIPYNDPFSLSSEVTFPRDCHSMPRLLSILSSMSDKLAYALRKKEMLASSVAVRIRYPDFTTATRQVSLPPAATGKTIASKAQDLFRVLRDDSRKVRLIGLRLGGLKYGAWQMQLFAKPGAREEGQCVL